MTEALAGRSVLVTGLGVSGAASLRALVAEGARVTVTDARTDGPVLEAAAEAERLGARVLLGHPGRSHPGRSTSGAGGLPAGTELVVTSPGWRPDDPLLLAAAAADVPVWGEVELAWRLRPADAAPWLVLTGTNGKTTTVRMLESILRAAGRRAVACGNVGLPVVEAVRAGSGDGPAPPYDVLAVELSSFQLHWTHSMRPAAAAALNVAPDHVDWHGSLEAYARDKGRIYRGAGVGVANADDPRTVRLLHASDVRRGAAFTLATPALGELGLVEDLLVDRAFVADPVAGAEELATLADLTVTGRHNVANALAAAALARAHGVPADAVRDGLRAFVPDPHRNALVATLDGVAYVDDSKATNPHAAAASLSAYPSIVWVAGGLAKGAEYDDLVAGAARRLRGVVLIGRDRARIADALARHAPQVPVVEVPQTDTGAMPATVAHARALARPGDTVLLAPAAASMDMFRDYTARGQAFAAAVAALTARDPEGPA
ncbi:MAG: UDP-N-acetylmuramoyl-L-alanine--D-glutamate ligase [Actinomycetota bacterium]|nr:UDP-N-acetylmuramoyl-L-alanine--D-glutamate ligase [Actinomycetota bacterium]